jgi:hypothetical protein
MFDALLRQYWLKYIQFENTNIRGTPGRVEISLAQRDRLRGAQQDSSVEIHSDL